MILVAGSGKLARGIGLHLAAVGLDVCWVSRDAERLAALEATMRRRAREFPGRVSFATPEAAPAADVLWESIEEDPAAKAELLGRLAARAALVLSNSSSILPSDLHPRAAGLHVFHPVGEVRLAEAILPAGYPDRAALEAFATRAALDLLVEDERSAFVATRILLPLQAEAFRCLAAGVTPARLDVASESALLPVGILTLMDAIGLDVLAAATAAYQRRMSPEHAAAVAPLVEGLALLVAQGKRGRKNRDGILVGAPLPWPETGASPPPGLSALVADGCRAARDRGLATTEALDRVLAEVWGASARLEAFEADGSPCAAVPL